MVTSSAPCEQTYDDVQKLLCGLVWRYCPHPNEFDEFMSVANLSFMVAYRQFDPSRSQITTWLTRVVGQDLQEFRRREGRFHSQIKSVDGELDENPDRPHRHDSLLADLSADAKTIVRLVLEAPDDLRRLLQRRPARAKRTLWRRLQSLGWTLGRVSDCFEEVSDAIQS